MNSSKTVLVVDDSRFSRLISRTFILSKYPDWIIEEAASGEEALEKMGRLSPRLVLMDVNMPGMGGIAASEKLRMQFPELCIFLQTANIQESTRNKAAAMGVGFIEKPISEERIHKVLAELENG
jgi:CheY-like chemotaxis protein